jgi:hypothetical protein
MKPGIGNGELGIDQKKGGRRFCDSRFPIPDSLAWDELATRMQP